MNGTINVFIPRTADGELMTGPVPKHRLPKVRSVDVRTFFDPLADRNLPNAIPAPKPKPFNPNIAPKGWSLRPVEPAPVAVEPVAAPARPAAGKPTCPRCGKAFRLASGLAWHVANMAA